VRLQSTSCTQQETLAKSFFLINCFRHGPDKPNTTVSPGLSTLTFRFLNGTALRASQTFNQIVKGGGILSPDEERNRDRARNVLLAYEELYGQVNSPKDVLEIGLWSVRDKNTPLRKSTWDTYKPHITYLVGERLGLSRKQVLAALGDGMVELNRTIRNLLPDAKLHQHARPMMDFYLVNLRKALMLDCLTPVEEELQAILELGLLTGARYKSIERITGASITKAGLELDCGFKADDVRSLTVAPSQLTPFLERVLSRKVEEGLDPEEPLFAWSVSRVNYHIDALCVKAGYPMKYFGAHSMRRGFVNQRLLSQLSKGLSLSDAIMQVCLISGWALTASSQVDSYVDESLRSVFLHGTADQFISMAPVEATKLFHGLSVVPRVVEGEHIPPHLLRILETLLELEPIGYVRARFLEVLIGLFDRYPQFEEDLEAAGCELYGSVDDTELATLGKRAIMNQLFHITPETIEYLGDGKSIVTLLRRAQIQSSAPVRPFKAVQIQKGKMSKVQAPIMRRRRVKRQFFIRK